MDDGDRQSPRVVYYPESGDESGSVPDVLGDATDLAVEVIPDRDSILEDLDRPLEPFDDDQRVDCIVVSAPVEAAVGFVEAVTDADPDVSVVLFPPITDPEAVGEALRAGATDYVPRRVSDGGSTLLDTVRTAVEDCAERRRRRRESDRYRALMRDPPFTVSFKDDEGRIVDIDDDTVASEEADELFGKTEMEIWGSSHGQSVADSYENDLRVAETGEPVVGHEVRREVGTETYWLRETKAPWRGPDGELLGSFGITTDVTEYRERERRLREQVSRLEGFASFVSHDLRNPLNVAQGYLELARVADDPAERDDALDTVADAVESMGGLVDDLLAMVRPEESDVSPAPVDVGAVASDVWSGFDTRSASLMVDVPDGTRIEAVEGQLRQLLGNLFRNAVEHGGADVDVVVDLSEAGLYVADDGTGLDVEDYDAVFEYGHTSGGTGIGLALVREIAEYHDWSVAAGESEHGGARFDVTDCVVLTRTYRSAVEGEPVELSERADVGGAAPPGEAVFDGATGAWTVRGGGRDLWAEYEQHHFLYAAVEPPVRVVATVTDVEHVHDYSKAGVMVRDDVRPGSPLEFVLLSASHGTEFGCRAEPDDEIWVRPVDGHGDDRQRYRVDLFDSRATAYVHDGTGWSTVGQRPLPASGAVAAGLAVCGHDTEQRSDAVFEDVRVVRLEPKNQVE